MQDTRSLYIDLLKKVLTDYHRLEREEYLPLINKNPYFHNQNPNWRYKFLAGLDRFLKKKNLRVCIKVEATEQERLTGKYWPSAAETMIGLKRLDNIEHCVVDVIRNNIEGDLIETGVWRGGATIFMKALLNAYGAADKVVWVADSFEGLPAPDEENYPADKGDIHHEKTGFVASLEEVKANFQKYGLLDDKVKFLKGWFKDTLPVAPIQKLAVLRLDGDMYESTMEALQYLYPKLSKGGYIIIDDWGAVEGCRLAVEDYRKSHNISEEIIPIDWTGVYWKKEA